MIIRSIPRSWGTLCLCLLLTRDTQALSTLFQIPRRVSNVASSRHANSVPTRNFAGIHKTSKQQFTNCIPEEGKDIIETIHESISTEVKANKLLLLACILLVVAQAAAGNESFSNALALPKNLAYSTVSASLLRESRTNRELSGKQLLTFAFLAWQIIMQAKSLASLTSSVFVKCSSWYVGCLGSYPLYTNACSSAVIGFFGDTAAQYVEGRKRIKREGETATPRKYDRRRGLSIAADGLFVTGPLLHVIYNFLETLIPVSGSSLPPSVAALAQVLIDDIFVDAFFVALTYLSTGITQGHGMKMLPHFKEDFIRSVKAGWATSFLLMPFEFICFRFLPVSLRVLGMNFIDIIWDGVLSFQVHKSRIGDAKNKQTSTTSSTKDLAFVAQ
jgi:hypothetical protein